MSEGDEELTELSSRWIGDLDSSDKITLIWAKIVCSTHSLIGRYITEIQIQVLQPTKHMQPRCGAEKRHPRDSSMPLSRFRTFVATNVKRRFEHTWYPVVIQNWCVSSMVMSLISHGDHLFWHIDPVQGTTEISGWSKGTIGYVRIIERHVKVF